MMVPPSVPPGSWSGRRRTDDDARKGGHGRSRFRVGRRTDVAHRTRPRPPDAPWTSDLVRETVNPPAAAPLHLVLLTSNRGLGLYDPVGIE
ncbi:hypothetical protein Landi51_02273 [Colletotrichum acutatum]